VVIQYNVILASHWLLVAFLHH